LNITAVNLSVFFVNDPDIALIDDRKDMQFRTVIARNSYR
jgi:hypothetical protein